MPPLLTAQGWGFHSKELQVWECQGLSPSGSSVCGRLTLPVPVLSLCPRAGFTAGSVLLSRAGGSPLPPFIYLFALPFLLGSEGVQVAAVSLYSSIWPQDS